MDLVLNKLNAIKQRNLKNENQVVSYFYHIVIYYYSNLNLQHGFVQGSAGALFVSLVTIFWDMKGPITIDFLEKGVTVNSISLLPTPLAKFTLFIECPLMITYHTHTHTHTHTHRVKKERRKTVGKN